MSSRWPGATGSLSPALPPACHLRDVEHQVGVAASLEGV